MNRLRVLVDSYGDKTEEAGGEVHGSLSFILVWGFFNVKERLFVVELVRRTLQRDLKAIGG
jgi:hypothetical protein